MKPFPHVLRALALAAFVAGGTAWADEPPAAAAGDAAKGQAASAACQACHVADGNRGTPAYPILQGQHPQYIAKQLADFKAGKRKNAVMSPMAMTLPDAEIVNVAAFYAGKQAKPGAAKNAATVRLGEQIYRGGIAAKAVAACSGCHGPAGAGIPAQYPRLAGQHADYTTAQLNAFRSGERGNSPEMLGVAARLSDAEIAAVADYVAGLR